MCSWLWLSQRKKSTQSGPVPGSKGTAPSLDPRGPLYSKHRAYCCCRRLVSEEEVTKQTWRGYVVIATASAYPLSLQLHCVIHMPLFLNLSIRKRSVW